MTLPFTKLGVDIAAGVDAGGNARAVNNGEMQRWMTEAERNISGAAAGSVDTVTWSALSAITGTRIGQPARVVGSDSGTHTDPVVGGTVANEGEYSWSTSPAGWLRLGELKRALVPASNVGAGTANAVEAATDAAFSTVAYEVLITVNFTASNTGAMTLSINGETPRDLVTNTGSPIPSGYVASGMSALLQIDGNGDYRLFSYGDAAAVQAAAEAAQVASEAAQSYAEEWAEKDEDDPVSVAAGGDASTTFSALHWAAKAEAAAGSVNGAQPAANIAEIEASDTSTVTAFVLKEAGKAGLFYWDSTDLSTLLTALRTRGVSSVDDSTEICTCVIHGLSSGTPISPTTSVNGLTADTVYFAIYVDGNSFKIADSYADAIAGTARDLTGTTTFTFQYRLVSGAIDSGTETITIPAHGLHTFDAVFPTTSANGLTADTLYYVIVVDADNVRLASSFLDAAAGTAFNLTGTTQFELKRYIDPLKGVFVIPTGKAMDGSEGAVRRIFTGPIPVDWFGGGVITAGPAQACHNLIAGLGGGTMLIPAGIHTAPTDNSSGASINIWSPMIVEGFGRGLNGNDTSGSTIRSSTAAGGMIVVTAAGVVTIRDFGIDAPGITKSAGTAGIVVDPAVAGSCRLTVERMLIDKMYVGYKGTDARKATIRDNWITNSTSIGISLENLVGSDLDSGLVENNLIWDVSAPSGATAGIAYYNGSARIIGNRVLTRSDYGLQIVFANEDSNSGPLKVIENSIERQDLYGIIASRSAGAASAGTILGHLLFSMNHIQGIDSGYQRAILIVGGSGWVKVVHIVHQVIQNTQTTSGGVIVVNDGDGVNIGDNIIDNETAGDSGVTVGGSSSNVRLHGTIVLGGVGSAAKYSVGGQTVIHQMEGVTYAQRGSGANGSQIFITDGTAGTPVTGSGTGSVAFRLNSGWKGF